MKIEITARNYNVSERLNQILTSKINKLNKYFPDKDTVCKVVLSGFGRLCKMELSIDYHGVEIRAEVSGLTMYYNIDECLPKVERQIVKHREKLSSRKKMPQADTDYQFVSEVEMEPLKIAKTKSFTVEAMTPEEAAENLELVGHDFYLFLNVNTGNVEAIYRRKDGALGLLQPRKEN